ncbi:NAD-dependent epimerase/dehydratase family protein [Rossellomorea vietnamensis]|uniref:NAD-dependent epimerase/dehydratase family protein n=1 Tax=Rossellomorea vietnamensis TaxID=218284 RepID=A0A5D4NIC5_9BACI|nr:SDR family oxidoreductase [Rossellomorea vietnamensis]TYS13767.1 NAD-dependent epimerase/dehydratase family protein [Rossellomorea vietnamensis]
MNIFLTGATGFVGKKLTEELLNDNHHLYVLCRNERKANAFITGIPLGLRKNVTCVIGNLSSSLLGLDLKETENLKGKVEAIFHMAAYLSFDPEQQKESFDVNLEGTRRALEFSEKIECRKFLYVSTAYTVGMETAGKEELYSSERKFVNHYEESKNHAEHLVHSYKDKMEVIILRPSIIIGDSRTGEADTTFGVYGLLKAASLLKRKVSKKDGWEDNIYRFLGEKELRMNLVPVDYVASVLKEALTLGENGKIYNITDPSPLKQKEIFQVVKEVLEFPNLELVPFSQKDKLSDLENSLNEALGIFKHYFTRELHFPCQNTLSLLERAGKKPLKLDHDNLKFILGSYKK